MSTPSKMEWSKLLCADRFGGLSITPKKYDARSPFDADADRVAFCSGFRRLGKKTQVHPFSTSDHTHTRLTHSMEVASVGKTLGKALAQRIKSDLPEGIEPSDLAAIVQAACLAHDLGNPAFGHAGEEAISQWFRSSGTRYLTGLSSNHRRDIETFEGNAQGFRMVTQTENYLFDGGLRLTYATLGAFHKYPWSSRRIGDSNKFGAFLSEEPILSEVADKVGLIPDGKNRWCRHPLAHLVEAADDICYSAIDLEDAVELNLISFAQAKEILLSTLDEDVRLIVSGALRQPESDYYRVNFARMRGPVFASLMFGVIEVFEKSKDRIMSGEFSSDLFGGMKENDPRRAAIASAKELGKKIIYNAQRKVEFELGCFSIFESLLDAFCSAATECVGHIYDQHGETSLSRKSELVLKLMGKHAPRQGNEPHRSKKWSKYECLRRALDYVSGMTDNYASLVATQLRGIPVIRSV